MKFIKKIVIDNFQSHQHTEIDFESGLNIIVGQSDKGKSAIIRALKWVLYNEPRGADFVRYGTNECSVTITTGDDFIITRKRKSNKNIYIIFTPLGEKLEFENFGNDVPVEVYEATGMKKIKLDTDIESRLNLNEQLDPPFLLSETGTVRAKAIGRIVNTNILDAAERDIQKDVANNNLILKGYEKQLSDIDEELMQYSNIQQEEENIKQIDKLFKKIMDIKQNIDLIAQYKDKLQSLNTSIALNNSTLSKLKALPDVLEKYTDLKEDYNLYNRLSNYSNKLIVIDGEYEKDCRIIKNLQHLETLEVRIHQFESKDSILKKLNELNQKHSNFSNDITKLKSLIQNYQGLNSIENNISFISSKILLHDKLTHLCQKLKDINTSISKGTAYMNELKKEFKVKIKEYSNKLKQIGKCPTCYCQIDDLTVNHIICELEGELNANN